MAEQLVPKDRIPWRHLALFGWLPSLLKVFAYRVLLGYRIGRGVRFSFGGIVVGKSVEIGDHVEIGFLAVVQGKTIKIGRYSSVGMMSYLSCEAIEMGEDAKIREQVYVGGPQLPESRFALGSRTIILQLTSINPTKPVIIGDDTGIGGHCLIFTHGAWLSALDGYPVNYEPVTLGKSVWLPWRVFVMPGSTIGDGPVIGANSLVSGAGREVGKARPLRKSSRCISVVTVCGSCGTLNARPALYRLLSRGCVSDPSLAAAPGPLPAYPRASRPRSRSRTGSDPRARGAARGIETPDCPGEARSARSARRQPPGNRGR